MDKHVEKYHVPCLSHSLAQQEVLFAGFKQLSLQNSILLLVIVCRFFGYYYELHAEDGASGDWQL